MAPRAEFEQLLAPIFDRAYGMALSLTRNEADAEDLLQEASLKAYRGFGSFETGTNFKAWFLRILMNTYLSDRRRAKRRPVGVDLDDLPDGYLYGEMAKAGLDRRSDDPARLLLERISVAAVRGAIEALPEEFRVVAALYFLEDFTYAEIAEVLDIPVGTVRSRLHRGRKVLQKSLWSIAVEEGIVQELTGDEAAV